MQALVSVHLLNHKMKVEELLRTAYMWRFDKDIPHRCLEEDAERFLKYGRMTPYLTDYMVECYGVH